MGICGFNKSRINGLKHKLMKLQKKKLTKRKYI